jgi:hypothetical protein
LEVEMYRILLRTFVYIVLLHILVGCGSSVGAPGAVIEGYLTALVELDNAKSVNLSCAAWEENARAEGASFEGVDVAIEGMKCSVVSEEGGKAVVSCDGEIVFSYAGGEDEKIPLSRRNYVLALEGGEWRMCGYE